MFEYSQLITLGTLSTITEDPITTGKNLGLTAFWALGPANPDVPY